MINTMVYCTLLLLTTLYAVLKGGAPERIAAATMAVGSFLTFTAGMTGAIHFRGVELGILSVDVVCLIVFLMLALRAARYWPLWVAAMQLIGTSGHMVRLSEAAIIPWAYAVILAIWSYPMLGLIAWGTLRHQQRLARNGADPSWSASFAMSMQRPRRGGRTG